jgi:hypothetical protein
MKTMIVAKLSKMKKNPREMVKEADNSILDELIGNCEEKMSSKFKKPEMMAEEEPSEELEMDDLDEDKKAILVELYNKLKGG